MNKKTVVVLSLMAVIITSFLSCKNMLGDAAATIDGDKITVEELNKFYYVQSKMLTNIDSKEEIDKLAENPAYANHPFLNKANFLEHLIAQKVLYEKAMDDKSLDQEELETLLEMVKIQTAAQYFLSKKLKDKIKITDEEIEMIYSKNRSRFAGRTAEEATRYIKQEVFKQKSRQETNKYVAELLAEHAINKDGFKEYMAKQSGTKTENSENATAGEEQKNTQK
ncbi:MAG TPA: hypothetical protein PK358_02195 [Spirochaetota bacterium]|nr:hypothetical protein [Spirochaetota bacterium]HPJ33616.1 hypothetical protein [Spirochaetota bacterium]